MVLRCVSVHRAAARTDGVSPLHMGILTDIGQSV
jgi:hypothetical protein